MEKNELDFIGGEPRTDHPQPIDKQIALALIMDRIDKLEEQEAHLLCQEEEQLLAQQSYQLDDFLEGVEEDAAFDVHVQRGISSVQITHTLNELHSLRKAVQEL